MAELRVEIRGSQRLVEELRGKVFDALGVTAPAEIEYVSVEAETKEETL